MGDRHLIDQLHFDIQMDQVGLDRAPWDDWPGLCRDRLLAVIEKVFQEFSPPGGMVYRLDSLEVDLGELPDTLTAEEVEARLQEVLRQRLGDSLPRGNEKTNPEAKATQAVAIPAALAELERLEFYLKQGLLPWNAKDSEGHDLPQSILRQAALHGHRLETLLLQDDQALERAVRQLPDAVLAELLATLFPQGGVASLAGWLPQVQQQATTAAGAEARYRIWRLAFRQRLQAASTRKALADAARPFPEQARESAPGAGTPRPPAPSAKPAQQTTARALQPPQLDSEDSAPTGDSSVAALLSQGREISTEDRERSAVVHDGAGREAVVSAQAPDLPSPSSGPAEDSGKTLAEPTTEGLFQGAPGPRRKSLAPGQAGSLAPEERASGLTPTANPRKPEGAFSEAAPKPALEPGRPADPPVPESTASLVTEVSNAAAGEQLEVQTHRQPNLPQSLSLLQDPVSRKNRETSVATAKNRGEVLPTEPAAAGGEKAPPPPSAMETTESMVKGSSLPAPDKATVPEDPRKRPAPPPETIQAKGMSSTTATSSAARQDGAPPYSPSLSAKQQSMRETEMAPAKTDSPLEAGSPTRAAAADKADAAKLCVREQELQGHAPSSPEPPQGQPSAPGSGASVPAKMHLRASDGTEIRSEQTTDAQPGTMPRQHQAPKEACPAGPSGTGRSEETAAAGALGITSHKAKGMAEAAVPITQDLQPAQGEELPPGPTADSESERLPANGAASVSANAALPVAKADALASESMAITTTVLPAPVGHDGLQDAEGSPTRHRESQGTESRHPAGNTRAPVQYSSTGAMEGQPTGSTPQEAIAQARAPEMKLSAKQGAANRGPRQAMVSDTTNDGPEEAMAPSARTSAAFAAMTAGAADTIARGRSDAGSSNLPPPAPAVIPRGPASAEAGSIPQGEASGAITPGTTATPLPDSSVAAAPASPQQGGDRQTGTAANDQTNANTEAQAEQGDVATTGKVANAHHDHPLFMTAGQQEPVDPATLTIASGTATEPRSSAGQSDRTEGKAPVAQTTPTDASATSLGATTPAPSDLRQLPPAAPGPIHPQTSLTPLSPGARAPSSAGEAEQLVTQEEADLGPHAADKTATTPFLPSRAWVEDALAAGGYELELTLAPLLAESALVGRMVDHWPEDLLARLMAHLRTEDFARLQPYAEAMTAANTWADSGTRRRHHWQYLAAALFPTPRFTSAAPFVCGYGDFMASLTPGRSNFWTELCANLAANPAQPILDQHIRYWLQGKGPASRPASAPAPLLPSGGLLIDNAGQVLIAPYLPRLFDLLGLLEKGRFIDGDHARRACHLLQYAVDERSDKAEHGLALNKLLCGLELQQPLEAGINISEREIAVIDSLLKGVIANWGALGSTSVAGLRQTFLQRGGVLSFQDEAWQLKVEPAAFDVLMDRLPWGLSIIRHAWMTHPVMVDWR